LRLVDSHRLIDSRQLCLALLGQSNRRHFLDRLERLSDQEYLDRPRAQQRPYQKPRPMIYALGIRGREHFDALDQIDRTGKRDWRLENDRLKLHTLEHEIAVTETVLALHLAATSLDMDFVHWSDPRYHADHILPTSVSIDPRHGEFPNLPLRPDAYIEATDQSGHTRHWFVELDRGTEPQVSANLRRPGIAQKMLAYWNYIWARLQDNDRRAHSWGALFVTTNDGRLHNMRRVAQDLVDPARKGTHSFLLTTMDRCQADPGSPLRAFDEPIWFSTKRGYDNPRPLFLQVCPICHQHVDPSNEAYVVVNALPHTLSCAPGTTLLPEHLPTDPEYAHHQCPGLTAARNE